ncbi:hypothetical protein [Treponema vincentii]|uniref:hypothetical protein n=1 Tax=Treponema vincentii TaxID=69710 RepID=UPI001E4B7A1B|nr:hypothetical protein [Treponema vincentii]
MIEQFVSDLTFEGQRYAVIVRAPVSSGIISAVHLPPLPEGYAFYGAAQLPAQKNDRSIRALASSFCSGRDRI